MEVNWNQVATISIGIIGGILGMLVIDETYHKIKDFTKVALKVMRNGA